MNRMSEIHSLIHTGFQLALLTLFYISNSSRHSVGWLMRQRGYVSDFQRHIAAHRGPLDVTILLRERLIDPDEQTAA